MGQVVSESIPQGRRLCSWPGSAYLTTTLSTCPHKKRNDYQKKQSVRTVKKTFAGGGKAPPDPPTLAGGASPPQTPPIGGAPAPPEPPRDPGGCRPQTPAREKRDGRRPGTAVGPSDDCPTTVRRPSDGRPTAVWRPSDDRPATVRRPKRGQVLMGTSTRNRG